MNERGFVFPLTLTILIFIIFFFMIHLQKGMSEKYFFYEIETFEKNQFVLLQTLKLIEEELKAGNREEGQMYISGTTVFYKIHEVDDSLLRIDLYLTRNDGRSVNAWAWFDLETMTTIKWLERN